MRNIGDRERSIEVTSYAELVLAPQSGDSAHPAFSKMFVRTEWLSERRCLVGTRRVRSPGDPSACAVQWRSEEHTSELQSLMRISYAVFCLKKKINNNTIKRRSHVEKREAHTY